MSVQIIPLRRMPSNLPFLDYLPGDFEGKISVGQLVTVPIRGKNEYGIVRQISNLSPISEDKLKPISSIVQPEPLLPGYLLEFYFEISEFYRAPLGFVVKSAILPLKKNKLQKIAPKLYPFSRPISLSPEKPVLLSYPDVVSRNNAVTKLAGAKGQTLILLPEISQIAPLAEVLGARLDRQPIIVSGEVGEKDYFDIWLKVRSDKNAVIIGTRKALFLPFSNLENIIVDDEGNRDHKSWDMAPRLNNRDAALMLMKHTGARLYLMSFTPSVESYYFAYEKIYDAAGKTEKAISPAPIFIDSEKERRITGAGFLADEVAGAIRSAHNDAFVFVSRRGTSNAVICRDCGRVFRCGSCRRPFTYFERDNKLHCIFCREAKTLNSTCPDCGGPSYKMASPGTMGFASELSKLMPEKRVICLDKDDPASLKNLNFPGGKVIVGTKFAWTTIKWPNVEIMAIADPDSLLALPEFRASEFLWQDIRRAQFCLNKTSSLYIQTSRPEHHVFQGLYNPAVFYATELAERRAFGYPPYRYVIRLILAGSEQATDREAARLAKSLADLTQQMSDVKITGPFTATPPYYRGRTWRIIIIKLSYSNYKMRAKEILKIVPDDWKIDPSPNNLTSIS